ncbi:MAG: hypothetical protein FMNOHCHN_00241 [Ignavibacteriaceae bacterium]|nr:hypothetical protein [Ignavibacteriaceae bacterium]
MTLIHTNYDRGFSEIRALIFVQFVLIIVAENFTLIFTNLRTLIYTNYDRGFSEIRSL